MSTGDLEEIYATRVLEDAAASRVPQHIKITLSNDAVIYREAVVVKNANGKFDLQFVGEEVGNGAA